MYSTVSDLTGEWSVIRANVHNFFCQFLSNTLFTQTNSSSCKVLQQMPKTFHKEAWLRTVEQWSYTLCIKGVQVQILGRNSFVHRSFNVLPNNRKHGSFFTYPVILTPYLTLQYPIQQWYILPTVNVTTEITWNVLLP